MVLHNTQSRFPHNKEAMIYTMTELIYRINRSFSTIKGDRVFERSGGGVSVKWRFHELTYPADKSKVGIP